MASDASIYQLANRPTVDLMNPLDLIARQSAIRNSLASGQLQDLQLEEAKRTQAADAQFRALVMGGGQAPAPGAMMPAAAAPAAPMAAPPGPAEMDPTTLQPMPTPPPMAGAAPPALPAVPPAAAPQNAPNAAHDLTDNQILGIYGTKGWDVIAARNTANTAAATRRKLLGEIAVQDTNYWGSLNAGWQATGYDPSAIPAILSQAAAHGLADTPQYQRFAQVASNPAAARQLAEQAVAASPEQAKLITERITAAANAEKDNVDTGIKRVQNAGALLGSTRDQKSYATAYARLKPEVQEQFTAPDLWTKDTAAEARERGRTADQQATGAETVRRDTDTAAWHRGELAARNAEVSLKRKQVSFDQGAIQRAGEALGRGELTRIRDIASLRGDQRLQIYDIAKSVNKNFSISEVDRMIKNEDYYANGKGADSLRSFNTFLEHAGAASDAVNAIRLSGVPAINKPLNWWRSHLEGSPELQQLVGSLEPVRKEFEGYLLGGHALHTDDRKAAEIILNDNSSPAQIQAALKTMGHTAVARAREENYRYKKVAKHDLEDAFSPEAIEGAKKIGTDLGFGAPAHDVPELGTTFHGGKVLSVTRVPD